jgi:hypothetical protein
LEILHRGQTGAFVVRGADSDTHAMIARLRVEGDEYVKTGLHYGGGSFPMGQEFVSTGTVFFVECIPALRAQLKAAGFVAITDREATDEDCLDIMEIPF